MTKVLENLREAVETILRCDLTNTIDIPEKVEAENLVEKFLDVVAERANQNDLAGWIDPQWVILAAGMGTRIDPLSNLNKNIDVWFGERNTLQLSRSCLPGSRPHILVISAQMASRVITTDIPTHGVVPVSALDQEAVQRLFGPNAILCIQPEQPYGTGAALRAALSSISDSDAEFIGVGFGDEPFLTDAERSEMWRRLECGEAYTNTGITIIRRDAAIARMDSLLPHGSRSELHHVDLIRHCYDDGLKTNAYIYEEENISGVNRWSNVLVGETSLFEKSRR